MNIKNIKIKAFIGLALLTVGLTACAPSVDGWKIIAAEKACAQRDGIDSLLTTFFEVRVTCRDGYFTKIQRGI
jgi:hypothetical protein